MNSTVSEDRIEEHFPLVTFIINRDFDHYVRNRICEFDDLFQVGCIYLLKAIRNFDSSKGYTFSTFASTHIWGGIQNHILRHNNLVKVPRQVIRSAKRIKKMELVNNTPEEISAELGCSVQHADKAKEYAVVSFLSLDAELDPINTGINLHNILPGSDDHTIFQVREFISSLPERDQLILLLRLRGLSQPEIAKQVGTYQVKVGRTLVKIGHKYLNYLYGNEVSA